VTPLFRGSVHAWAQTLIQILAVTGILILLVRKGSSEPENRRLAASCLLPVAVLTLASALFSPGTLLTVDGCVMLFAYLAVFYLTVCSVKTRAEQRTLVHVILATAVFISLVGILKRFEMNFLGLWEYPDILWRQYKSLTGPYVNRNHMAGFLEMAIPLLLGLFLTKERSREKILGMVCLVLFLIVTLGLTLSRGGWIGAFSGLMFMLVVLLTQKNFKKKEVLIGVAVASFVGVILLVSTPVVKRIMTLTQADTTDNLKSRLIEWEGTLNIIQDHFFWGTGPGTFSTVYPAYQKPGASKLARYAHNDYLHFISDTGIFFIPVMFWLLYLIFKSGFKKLKSKSRQKRGLALGAMGGVVAILVHSFSDFNLHIPANIILFTILSATVLQE
jgi:O-Antigen ligase